MSGALDAPELEDCASGAGTDLALAVTTAAALVSCWRAAESRAESKPAFTVASDLDLDASGRSLPGLSLIVDAWGATMYGLGRGLSSPGSGARNPGVRDG